MTSLTYFRVVPSAELPNGTKKPVDVDGKSILICHSANRIYAVSNICSHAAEKLECGKMSNGWIACPIHGARFDLATGRVKNPPATRPIAVYETRTVDDWIEVGMEAETEKT